MKYTTANAFRTALEQRLLTRANESHIPLIRLRKLVVFDRLMARLIVVAPDRWVLKGAVALQFRAGPQYRTTKDVDFGRSDSDDAASADFLAAQSVDLGDFFSFAIERAGFIDIEGEGRAVRYHARAELAGRLFETFVVDVGFDDPSDAPDMLRGPDLLEFAEIASIEIPVLPLERHVAEKIHAYTAVYAGGRPSSRVKDLVDLVLIASLFSLQAERLSNAIESTFGGRNSPPPPILPPPPTQWRIPYRKMAGEVGLDPDVASGYERARTFLDPVLRGGLSPGAKWDPASHAWC
jgi:hypothetical protein